MAPANASLRDDGVSRCVMQSGRVMLLIQFISAIPRPFTTVKTRPKYNYRGLHAQHSHTVLSLALYRRQSGFKLAITHILFHNY